MATVAERAELRTKLELYEGCIEHMYLDTEGFVTVGVGHLLTSVAAAQQLKFIHQKSGKPATKDEIKVDYESVKRQPKGLFAAFYKRHTRLKLPRVEIDGLTNKHIDVFEVELKRIYGAAEFAAFPSNVRLGLFDMIFNLGMTKLQHGFPAFNAAIKAKDWKRAAAECNRQKISNARNQYVKGLLESAATSAKP